jgi:hypothetical protein
LSLIKAQTLQQDLRDLAKERAEEIASARTKQHQYDRRIADMSLSISRLQSIITKKESADDSMEFESKLGDDEKTRQIKELSGQLVRQQEKSGQLSSEISALKSRLEVALNRAAVAEAALAAGETTGDRYDIESAPSSGNYGGEGMRRRGVRRKKKAPKSVRSALFLDNTQNTNVEKVGRVIDVLDTFSVQCGECLFSASFSFRDRYSNSCFVSLLLTIGNYLRRNPLARGGFALYLLLLHFWTFVVIVFHAHSYESVHGDFGGKHLPHGPHALMQQFDPQQLREQQQQVMEKIKQNVADATPLSLGESTNKVTGPKAKVESAVGGK